MSFTSLDGEGNTCVFLNREERKVRLLNALFRPKLYTYLTASIDNGAAWSVEKALLILIVRSHPLG